MKWIEIPKTLFQKWMDFSQFWRCPGSCCRIPCLSNHRECKKITTFFFHEITKKMCVFLQNPDFLYDCHFKSFVVSKLCVAENRKFVVNIWKSFCTNELLCSAKYPINQTGMHMATLWCQINESTWLAFLYFSPPYLHFFHPTWFANFPPYSFIGHFFPPYSFIWPNSFMKFT